MRTLRGRTSAAIPNAQWRPLTVLPCTIGNTSKPVTSPAQTNSRIVEIMVKLLQQARVRFELVIDLHRQVTLTCDRA